MIYKLFKYDLRGVGKRLFPIYGLAIVMSIVARFMFVNRYMNPDFYNSERYLVWWFELLSGITFAVTWMVIAAIFVVTFFMLASQYQKSVFGDEGYLTNTLPIKTEKIIIAKALNFLFWNFIAGIISIVCVCIMFVNGQFIKDFYVMIQDVFDYVITYMDVKDWAVFVIYAITFLISSISGIFLVYFSMAIGSQAKHKLAMGFVAYIGISMLTSFISQLVYTAMWFPDVIMNTNYYNAYDYRLPMFTITGAITSLVLTVIFCGIYFFGTYYIQKNKLNLE